MASSPSGSAGGAAAGVKKAVTRFFSRVNEALATSPGRFAQVVGPSLLLMARLLNDEAIGVVYSSDLRVRRLKLSEAISQLVIALQLLRLFVNVVQPAPGHELWSALLVVGANLVRGIQLAAHKFSLDVAGLSPAVWHSADVRAGAEMSSLFTTQQHGIYAAAVEFSHRLSALVSSLDQGEENGEVNGPITLLPLQNGLSLDQVKTSNTTHVDALSSFELFHTFRAREPNVRLALAADMAQYAPQNRLVPHTGITTEARPPTRDPCLTLPSTPNTNPLVEQLCDAVYDKLGAIAIDEVFGQDPFLTTTNAGCDVLQILADSLLRTTDHPVSIPKDVASLVLKTVPQSSNTESVLNADIVPLTNEPASSAADKIERLLETSNSPATNNYSSADYAALWAHMRASPSALAPDLMELLEALDSPVVAGRVLSLVASSQITPTPNPPRSDGEAVERKSLWALWSPGESLSRTKSLANNLNELIVENLERASAAHWVAKRERGGVLFHFGKYLAKEALVLESRPARSDKSGILQNRIALKKREQAMAKFLQALEAFDPADCVGDFVNAALAVSDLLKRGTPVNPSAPPAANANSTALAVLLAADAYAVAQPPAHAWEAGKFESDDKNQYVGVKELRSVIRTNLLNHLREPVTSQDEVSLPFATPEFQRLFHHFARLLRNTAETKMICARVMRKQPLFDGQAIIIA